MPEVEVNRRKGQAGNAAKSDVDRGSIGDIVAVAVEDRLRHAGGIQCIQVACGRHGEQELTVPSWAFIARRIEFADVLGANGQTLEAGTEEGRHDASRNSSVLVDRYKLAATGDAIQLP